MGGAPGEEAWRWGLRITPCLTLGAAILLLLFLYDPPRGESEGKTVLNKSSYFDDLRYIARVKRNITETLMCCFAAWLKISRNFKISYH